MRRIWYILLLPLAAILMGCSATATLIQEHASIPATLETRVNAKPVSSASESLQTSTEKPTESIVIEPTAGTPSYDPALKPLVSIALKDLSDRLGIDIDEIKVLEAKHVVWPDASLGCPQPDMAYAQILVDGTLIRLGVGKEMYFYHSGGNEDPFLCEGTSRVIPKVTPKIDEFVPPPDSEID